MIFCENCRANKQWPKSAVVSVEKCLVCGESKECYDVPSIKLIPKAENTTEHKMIYEMMQGGFREKAEALVVTNFNGLVHWGLTAELRKAVVRRNGKIDWYDTYQTRVALQKAIELNEKIKSHRRVNHV